MPDAAVLSGRADAPVASAVSRDERIFTGRRLLVVVFALVALRAVFLIAALPTDHSPRVSAYFTDGERYHRVANADGTPYRDHTVEYPPVTVAFIELVDGDDVRSTLWRLGVASFVLDLLVLAAIAYGFGRRAAVAYLVLSTPFVLLPFIYFRVDLLVVALTMLGLALAKRNRQLAGGGLLALAVFAKLWPLVVLPVLLVDGRRRAAVTAAIAGAVGAVAWFAVGGVVGFEQVLTFRGARGFQIESVAGGVTRWFTGEIPRSESGALRIGDVPFAATLALGVLMAFGVAWTWWRAWRSGVRSERLMYGVAPLTAVTIFMVCSPLLSPQFLVWIVPFGAIAWACGERVLSGLVGLVVVATMLLTQVYGPLNDDLPVGHGALAFRNGLLLAIVVVGLWRVATETRQAAVGVGAPTAALVHRRP